MTHRQSTDRQAHRLRVEESEAGWQTHLHGLLENTHLPLLLSQHFLKQEGKPPLLDGQGARAGANPRDTEEADLPAASLSAGTADILCKVHSQSPERRGNTSVSKSTGSEQQNALTDRPC